MAKKKTPADPVPRQADRHKSPRKHVPIPLELFEQLEEIAKANERPVGWEAARAIKAHVAAERSRLGLPDA